MACSNLSLFLSVTTGMVMAMCLVDGIGGCVISAQCNSGHGVYNLWVRWISKYIASGRLALQWQPDVFKKIISSIFLKFGFSEKTTKFEKIFVVLLIHVQRRSCSVRATAYLSKSRQRFFKTNIIQTLPIRDYSVLLKFRKKSPTCFDAT